MKKANMVCPRCQTPHWVPPNPTPGDLRCRECCAPLEPVKQ